MIPCAVAAKALKAVFDRLLIQTICLPGRFDSSAPSIGYDLRILSRTQNMKLYQALILGCVWHISVHASDAGQDRLDGWVSQSANNRLVTQEDVVKKTLRMIQDNEPIARSAHRREGLLYPRSQIGASSLAKAIDGAHRKGVIESGVEAYTEVLTQCQRETSQLQIVPFMRSDSQQAHCYRF